LEQQQFADKTRAPFWQACYGQEVAQVRDALEPYSKKRRERIIVAAFAPSAYISKDLCMKVIHYVYPLDLTTYFEQKGKEACEDPQPDCKQECHELNPIYFPYIEKEIIDYQDLLKDYDH
jgi:hypothetical protein